MRKSRHVRLSIRYNMTEQLRRKSMENLVRGGIDFKRVPRPHALWVGCGDMCRRSMGALTQIRKDYNAHLTFIDVRDVDKVKQAPPSGAAFFNIARPKELSSFRQHLSEQPASHIYIANLPHQHLVHGISLGRKVPCREDRDCKASRH